MQSVMCCCAQWELRKGNFWAQEGLGQLEEEEKMRREEKRREEKKREKKGEGRRGDARVWLAKVRN